MEIVWVFGSSGAGKETLIRGLSRQGHQLHLIQQLGWEHKRMVVCDESVQWIAQHENDPVLDKRATLPVHIKAMATHADAVVLIKGQDVDLELGLPEQVKTRLPEAKHRVIFIDTPIATLFERWKKKLWWNDDYTLKTVKQWQDYQLGMLHKLPADFVCTTVSSVDADSYNVVEGLPKS